jgi:hypothetical protein
MAKSDLTFGLCLRDETVQVMKRFCDSVDFLKQASQSGAAVSLQWPDDGIVPTVHHATTNDIVATHATTAKTAPTAPIVPIPAAASVVAQACSPAPAQTPTFTPAIPQAAPTAVPTYTMDQIARAGAELAQAGKMPQLLALLQQFGVQAVTMIPEAQYGAFATALRGLGAQL